MKLEETVRELLFYNDCVIVPQFGAFVSNYEMASIREQGQTVFSPPSKKLIFNSKLTHNDGLLLNYIATQENVDFSTAAALVQKAIWEIEHQLRQSAEYTFGTLGVFSMPESETISFEPIAHEMLLADSFGLDSFEFKPINNKPAIRARRDRGFADLVRRATSSKIAKPIIFALPIAIAASFLKPVFVDSFQTSSLEIVADSDDTDAVLPKETEVLIDQHLEEETNQRSQLVYHEPEYHIIIGSFREQANAMEFMSKEEFGSVKAELLFENELYRISVGNYSSKEIARKRLVEMRVRNRAFKNAWVFTKQ